MTVARPRPPRPLGDATEHYWRVQRMARATGLDLVEAQQDGALDPRHWAGMVRRCRGCAWAEACGLNSDYFSRLFRSFTIFNLSLHFNSNRISCP